MSDNEEERAKSVNSVPPGKNNEHVATGAETFRVGVKIPPFWPQEPEVWFKQVEGQFILSNITSDTTKFYYVLSQLEQQYAAEVKDIIISPPASDKYEKLKSELIKRLSASREKKLKTMLLHEDLGDRKPSQFLRHLQHVAGPDVPEDFMKSIWTSRLPHNIQSAVATQPTSTLDSLADLADRVWDIAPSTPQVASTTGHPESVTDLMVSKIAALTKQMQELTNEMRSRSRPRYRDGGKPQHRERSDSQRRGYSQQRSQSSYRKFPVCWYHFKFQQEATRCVKPCDFPSGNEQGNR
ncbi:uncharacterized protein LOC125231383 [Leguminivora glycinivorella]|uniref:uncharacterized protein LOC125231383 n=1 Tax=Leguminivora glycinivorella TaxID=1035111 RepID=UPI00200F36CE|nr:uncharacterized protein LOC125231383 [Leguminivora glycinivorella]